MDGNFSENITSEMAKHYAVFGGPCTDHNYFYVDDKSQFS